MLFAQFRRFGDGRVLSQKAVDLSQRRRRRTCPTETTTLVWRAGAIRSLKAVRPFDHGTRKTATTVAASAIKHVRVGFPIPLNGKGAIDDRDDESFAGHVGSPRLPQSRTRAKCMFPICGANQQNRGLLLCQKPAASLAWTHDAAGLARGDAGLIRQRRRLGQKVAAPGM